MPSIVITYSPNLEGEFDLEDLTNSLNQRAQDLDVFPAWGVRVLAVKADAAMAGDGDAELGYVQVSVRIAPGRLRELQKRITNEFFAVVDGVLGKVTTRKLGYAVDLTEFDKDTYKSGGTLPGSPTA